MTFTREDLAANVTIYRGDCRDVIPVLQISESIVHVITDAPYEDEIHDAARDRRIKRTDGLNTEGDFGFAGINADRAEYARQVSSGINRLDDYLKLGRRRPRLAG